MIPAIGANATGSIISGSLGDLIKSLFLVHFTWVRQTVANHNKTKAEICTFRQAAQFLCTTPHPHCKIALL
nr:hypothetical protein [Aquicoccus sp. G2-2]MEA1113160.1 hypothetical protein [Aquicoccus sp. G2-2]